MAILKLRSVLIVASCLYLVGVAGCASQEPFRLNSAFGKKPKVEDPKLANALQAMKQAQNKKDVSNGDYAINTTNRADEIIKKVQEARGKDDSSFTGKIKAAAGSTASYVGGAFRPITQQAGIASSDPTSLSHKPGSLNADLFVKSAAHFEAQGNITAAFEQYQRALQIEANDKAALVGLGRLCHRQGKMQEAIQTYQRALAAHPKDSVVLNDLGLCYARLQNFEQAIETMRAAMQVSPDSGMYRNNLAAIYVEAGRPSDAVNVLAEVHSPAIANYNVGYLLNQRHQIAEATNYFAKALSFDPNMEQARTMLAKMSSPTTSDQPQYLQARRPLGNDMSSSKSLAPIVLPHQAPAAQHTTSEIHEPQFVQPLNAASAPFNYQTAAKSFTRTDDPGANQKNPSRPNLLPPTEEPDPMQQVLGDMANSSDVTMDHSVSAASYVVTNDHDSSSPHSVTANQSTQSDSPSLRMPTLNSRRRGKLIPPTPLSL